MKNLWTPWRMDYILGRTEKVKGCLFCQARNSVLDREKLILCRDKSTVVMLNRFPYANGHLLVAPRRHLSDISDLNPRENMALMAKIQQGTMVLRRHLRPDGFNIGLNLGPVAGAGIADHLHFHIVPRWNEDHNFMTVIADIRTIPEHIQNTFDQLLPDFQTPAGLRNSG